jgi:N-acetylmuramoyl-L-alanine amidase
VAEWLRACALAAALVVLPANAAPGASGAEGAPLECGEPARVTLDIGHSPGRPGAVSARGRPEYAFNRRIAFELAAALETDHGFAVTILNPSGRDIGLAARGAEIATIAEGVLISIHHDSVQPHYLSAWTVSGRTRHYSDLFAGFSLFVSGRSAEPGKSLDLARAIGGRLTRAGFRPSLHHGEAIAGENRPLIDAETGIFSYDGLVVLKAARVPAVLLEVGVIVNRAEERALEDTGTRARIVAAIAGGLGAVCR